MWWCEEVCVVVCVVVCEEVCVVVCEEVYSVYVCKGVWVRCMVRE